MYFHKKTTSQLLGKYWATKYESRWENKFWATCHNISNLFDGCWHPLLKAFTDVLISSIIHNKSFITSRKHIVEHSRPVLVVSTGGHFLVITWAEPLKSKRKTTSRFLHNKVLAWILEVVRMLFLNIIRLISDKMRSLSCTQKQNIQGNWWRFRNLRRIKS